MSEDTRRTSSDIEVKPVYTEADVPGLDLGAPGEFPYARGVHPTMYRGRPWTIRQYMGYGTAEETNARIRFGLDHGVFDSGDIKDRQITINQHLPFLPLHAL